MIIKENYVEFWYPGIIMSEPDCRPILNDTVIKPGCYAVQFKTRVKQDSVLEDGRTIEHIEYVDDMPLTYIDGQFVTGRELLDDPTSGEILRSNISGNHNEEERFVRTRVGQVLTTRKGELCKTLAVVEMWLKARKPDTSSQ